MCLKIIYNSSVQRYKPVSQKLRPLLYDAKSLVDIRHQENKSELEEAKEQLSKITDTTLNKRMLREYQKYRRWKKTGTTNDQRRKQRHYETLAHSIWDSLSDESFIELHDLAWQLKIPSRNLFRLVGKWTDLGLIETVHLNRGNLHDKFPLYDIRKKAEVLTPLIYVIPKDKIPQFHRSWTNKTKTLEEI